MVVIKSRLIRTIVDNYQHVLPTWMIAVTVYVCHYSYACTGKCCYMLNAGMKRRGGLHVCYVTYCTNAGGC